MIASLRGVLVLVAVALALGALAIVDAMREPPDEDHALVPGLDPARVDRLTWTSPGGAAFAIARGPDGWTRSTGTRADASAVDAVLSALRGGRWHRRRDAADPASGVVLQVAAGEASVARIAVGPALPGTEQVWLVRDGAELLVDAWVARALMPAPWMFLLRQPFADASRGTYAIAIAGSRFAIDHGRRASSDPGATRSTAGEWIEPALIDTLARAMGELTFAGEPGAPVAAPQLEIRVGVTARLAGVGPCAGQPNLVAIDTHAGTGCVARASWEAVEHAARALRPDAPDTVDRRPLPMTPGRIELAGGTLAFEPSTALTLDGASHPVDLDRTTELRAALATPGEIVATPTTRPAGVLVGRDHDDAIATLDLHAPDLVVRREDGVALRIGTGAWEILARPATRYRDRTLLREEPTTIASVTIDGTTWQRGEVVGEWRTTGASSPRPALERFVATVARLRGLDAEPPRGFATRHRVTLVVAQPGSSTPVTHTLELGAPTAAGCPVRAAGREILVPREACSLP